jgi:hypothetical protein
MLISLNFNLVIAADNYKLHAYGDADSDAGLLVAASKYSDVPTAQKAIYHNDVTTPWRVGTYEFATQKFVIYTETNANWNGSQWGSKTGICPIVYAGQSFMNNSAFSPVIFFIAPDAAIYKVSAIFQYQSTQGKATAGSSLYQFKAKGGTAVVNMNFGKNYTDQSLLASDFYVNLHAGDTITFNQNCTLWGDPFCVWTKLQVLGNNKGLAFTSTEANESGFYFDNYLVGTDFSFLNTKIADSETLIGSAQPGTTLGTYPASAITLFQTAIVAAKNFVLNQPNAKQVDINTQLAKLSTAYATFTKTFKSSVIVADNATAEFKLASGLYNIRLKGTDLYLTAPTAKGNTPPNRAAYQPLRDANVQNCQKWNIQFNLNSGFTNPPRYSFVSGIDVNTDWTEENAFVVGHLDEAGYFRDKNTAETQIGDEGLYHNFTIYYNGAAYGLTDVGLNTPLNMSATVSGETVSMSYETTAPMQFLYEFISAPNSTNALNQIVANNIRILNVENGIRITVGKVAPVSVYSYTGLMIKNCIVNSDVFIALTKGIYIVKSENTIQKVIIR